MLETEPMMKERGVLMNRIITTSRVGSDGVVHLTLPLTRIIHRRERRERGEIQKST